MSIFNSRERSNIDEMDKSEILNLLEIASQVRQSSYAVIQGAVNYEFVFRIGEFPSEVWSEKNPAVGRRDRGEEIRIDGFLGLYDSSRKEITVFSKGIQRAAELLKASPEDLQQIVLLHEWAHALLHLGIEQTEYRSMMLNGSLSKQHAAQMDSWFNTLDPDLHETLAQLLVREGLRWLREHATIPKSQASIDRIHDVFTRLMRRSPSRYRIEKFENVRQNRIVGSIRLLKNGGLVGADAWETVLRW